MLIIVPIKDTSNSGLLVYIIAGGLELIQGDERITFSLRYYFGTTGNKNWGVVIRGASNNSSKTFDLKFYDAYVFEQEHIFYTGFLQDADAQKILICSLDGKLGGDGCLAFSTGYDEMVGYKIRTGQNVNYSIITGTGKDAARDEVFYITEVDPHNSNDTEAFR